MGGGLYNYILVAERCPLRNSKNRGLIGNLKRNYLLFTFCCNYRYTNAIGTARVCPSSISNLQSLNAGLENPILGLFENPNPS